MIQFIQKVLFLLEKVNHRTRVLCERDYVANVFREYIEKDDVPLREELAKLKALKEPNSETKKKIMDLDTKITEIMTYRSMIAKSDSKVNELNKLIENTKRFLWK